MTARVKAQELLEKFSFVYTEDGLGVLDRDLTNNDRKECALVVANEMLETLWDLDKNEFENNYWQKVKEEIINL